MIRHVYVGGFFALLGCILFFGKYFANNGELQDTGDLFWLVVGVVGAIYWAIARVKYDYGDRNE